MIHPQTIKTNENLVAWIFMWFGVILVWIAVAVWIGFLSAVTWRFGAVGWNLGERFLALIL
jgi:hypothetical protein